VSGGEIRAADVKALRDRTGAGLMDCKAALQEAGGDVDKAIEILRVKGQAQAAKRSGRAASEGAVGSYIHTNGKIGVLVEVNSETDFVARNGQFQGLVKMMAETRIFEEQAADKPEQARPKIVEGKLRKWMEDNVLLNQEHVHGDKHDGKTIEQLRQEIASKTGENVVIRRFSRYVVGEE
jgi:elongation factor Ts